MELNGAGSWKMHITALLYSTLRGSASLVASDWAEQIGAWHSWCFQDSFTERREESLLSSHQSAIPDRGLFSAHFSFVSAASSSLHPEGWQHRSWTVGQACSLDSISSLITSPQDKLAHCHRAPQKHARHLKRECIQICLKQQPVSS